MEILHKAAVGQEFHSLLAVWATKMKKQYLCEK